MLTEIDVDQKPPGLGMAGDSQSTLEQAEKDIDELAEFDDEDEEDDTGFQVRDPLKAPKTNVFTTKDLHSLIHEGLIDLTPAYQRDVVWSETKQIHLIDSIFRNFYIPPVIFAVQTDDEGEEVRVCVDGKQRLTSIQKFFDGQIPHRDTKTKKSYWYTISETNRKSRLEIPASWKENFSKKQVTCVEYRNIAPGTEREIFQRVQLGMMLSAAEKLQAISSPWAEWVSTLEKKHVLSDNGLSTILNWDSTRGRAFQCVAHMVYCCDGVTDQPLPTAQKLERWLLRVDPPSNGFMGRVDEALNEFWVIATDKSSKHYSKGFHQVDKRVAPVEFAFIGILMYVMRDFSRHDRAEAIFNMRTYIRRHFADIRNNANVGRQLWHFVRSITHPGSVSLDEALATAPKRKRKAQDDDGDDEDEYRPSAISTLSKPLKTRSTKKR